MKKLNMLLVLMSITLFYGCPQKNETLGDKIKDAGDTAGENLKEVKEEVVDEIDDATTN